MWPWEHLVFGYVLYSVGRRVGAGETPGEGAVVALAVGTQFPDLVDKPLAWTFGVLPTGVSLAHSLVTAAVVCGGVVALSRPERTQKGVAFAAGYLSHLLGDALYPLLVGGEVAYRFLLWPLVDAPRQVGETTFLAEFLGLLANFRLFLGTGRGRLYLLFEVLLVGGAVLLWLADGWPGVRWLGTVGRDRRDRH